MIKYKRNVILVLTLVLVLFSGSSKACTNFLVGKKASVDGSTMISYAADSHVLFGELYHWPAVNWPAGAMLDIREWDTGKFLGKIKQVAQTYSVVGNMNEYQVAIGETTFGGHEDLADSTAIMDYGSLIYVALQRSKTAREAIHVMTSLVAEYGYYSEGESFSIADPNEIWIMEMIGKGVGNKGAVWVAQRIPDDCVSGHANQSRITKINFNDKENVLYSKDVVSFAREKGYFKGKDADFDFAAAYNPIDFSAVRFCDARVWSMFRKLDPAMDKYLPYINGENAVRMPLYIKPKHKVSLREMKNFMRDHFEGTPLDMSKDVGAGPFGLPYRWRPLTWKVDSIEYFNERAVATQQTGFSFVAQMRSFLPNAVGGVLWFGVDDAATTVYTPMYCCLQRVPECFREGNGSMLEFSWTSAFWIFNWVSNQAYTRYSYMIKDIAPVQKQLEDQLEDQQNETEAKAVQLYNRNSESVIDFLTNYSNQKAEDVTARWKKLGEFLMVKYMDGNIKKTKNGKFITNGFSDVQAASPSQPGYDEKYYKAVVNDTGDKLKMRSIKQ